MAEFNNRVSGEQVLSAIGNQVRLQTVRRLVGAPMVTPYDVYRAYRDENEKVAAKLVEVPVSKFLAAGPRALGRRAPVVLREVQGRAARPDEPDPRLQGPAAGPGRDPLGRRQRPGPRPQGPAHRGRAAVGLREPQVGVRGPAGAGRPARRPLRRAARAHPAVHPVVRRGPLGPGRPDRRGEGPGRDRGQVRPHQARRPRQVLRRVPGRARRPRGGREGGHHHAAAPAAARRPEGPGRPREAELRTEPHALPRGRRAVRPDQGRPGRAVAGRRRPQVRRRVLRPQDGAVRVGVALRLPGHPLPGPQGEGRPAAGPAAGRGPLAGGAGLEDGEGPAQGPGGRRQARRAAQEAGGGAQGIDGPGLPGRLDPGDRAEILAVQPDEQPVPDERPRGYADQPGPLGGRRVPQGVLRAPAGLGRGGTQPAARPRIT